MTRKAAVFSHSGLGDGLISLVVSNNFHQNGWDVDTYHNGLALLQSWFPHLPIQSYPSEIQIPEILSQYEKIVIFYNDVSSFLIRLVDEGKKEDPERIKVIYPIPSNGMVHKPYYQDSLINPRLPLVESLKIFCEEGLHLTKSTKKNGFIAPLALTFRKNPKRVVLHVNSSRAGKNWKIDKYVKLALHLIEESYQPVIIAGSPKEREAYSWLEREGFILPFFEDLNEVTAYLYESGYLIGNDSGLGHLASCMGIPTVTIGRRKAVARFWRPNWAPSNIVVPSSLIPNIAGFRLRDRNWQKFVSVKMVIGSFKNLVRRSKKEIGF